jgi:rhodanese-related sulfurtransferase
MGPLVPDIISNEFNYFIAIIVGIGFGFALEQAGFSSTKKLVGLFYGYDFTVLKVFFTAGVTAMIGILLLGHLGLLNLEYVFVNPFFVRSAIVGGLIMGAGFIIGGFCPGTSFCAAAIGKVDAMAFIVGAVLGILVFMEAFPLLADFYKTDALGPVVIADFFNMSRTSWAVLLTVVAVLAFIGVTVIQQKVTGKMADWRRPNIIKMMKWALGPVLVLVFIVVTPTRDEYVMAKLEKKAQTGECSPRVIDSDKLAYELVNNYYAYNVIDVRSKAEYDSFHIATAINIPLNELGNLIYRPLFRQRIKTNLFYGNSMKEASRACLLARYHGDKNGLALREDAAAFRELFYGPVTNDSLLTKHELTVFLFRKDAAQKMREIEVAVSNLSKPVEKKVRVVQGGCS